MRPTIKVNEQRPNYTTSIVKLHDSLGMEFE